MTNKDSKLNGLKIIVLILAPVWLPFYWCWELILGFVGICYYVVVERTITLFIGRGKFPFKARIRWYLVPLLIIAFLPAVIFQLLMGGIKFLWWWHINIGRWQSCARRAFWNFVFGVLAEAVMVVTFVGVFYHNLPWRFIGYSAVPARWYHIEGQYPIRVFLWGPFLFGLFVLIILPTILQRFQKLTFYSFFPRLGISLVVLYHTLLSQFPLVNHRYVLFSIILYIGLMFFFFIKLADNTLTNPVLIKQFVWFSAVRLFEKKRIAFFSLGAVSLCTMMLLIVVSVMGGFVEQIREKTHGLMGDIVVEGDPARGFPYYDEFMKLLKKPPLSEIVECSTPVIYTAGLFRVRKPYNPDAYWTSGVRVQGIDLETKIAVTKFGSGLYYYKIDPARVVLDKPITPPHKPNGEKLYGMIYGIDVAHLSYRDPDGNYHRKIPQYWPATLSVFPITIKGTFVDTTSPAITQKFYLVDDSRTGVYDIDSTTVYVDFHMLQKLLLMDRQELSTGKTLPARAHQIQIKLKPNVDLYQALRKIKVAWVGFTIKYDDPLLQDASVYSWEEYNAMFISAIENEKRLMIILFGIISMVVVFLILVIFYMIVVEKTKDIGILKSLGATNGEISAIFLGYATVIGFVGAIIGAILGYYFVRYINEIQDWLIKVFGWRVWNREIYAFDLIPNKVDINDAIMIIIAAIIASVVGAIIPAIKASKLNPVETLRYE